MARGPGETAMRAISCMELLTAITSLLEQNEETFVRSVSQIQKLDVVLFINVNLILRITWWVNRHICKRHRLINRDINIRASVQSNDKRILFAEANNRLIQIRKIVQAMPDAKEVNYKCQHFKH